MRCRMCECKYCEEHGDSLEGFCSEACANVYRHIDGLEKSAAADSES